MKPASPKLSSTVRWTAAGCLALWLVAITHCSAACQDDCCGAEHVLPVAADAGSHHSLPPDDSLCDSLHSVCPVSPMAALIKPDFGLAILTFVSPSQTVASTLPEAPVSRQPPDRERLLTPEVCLGPAFRSLAPPVSSPS